MKNERGESASRPPHQEAISGATCGVGEWVAFEGEPAWQRDISTIELYSHDDGPFAAPRVFIPYFESGKQVGWQRRE